MPVISISGLIIALLAVLCGICIEWRNRKVYLLKKDILNRSYEWHMTQRHRRAIPTLEASRKFMDHYEKLPEYEAMVFSLKPIKPEQYLNSGELKELGLI